MRMMFGGPGGPGGGGQMEPAITSDQFERYATMLKLTPEQHDAAKALFDGYFADHQARATKMRDMMESVRDQFRETRDPSVFQEMGEKMRAFREEGGKAEKQVMEDIKSVLTPEQENLWPAVERTKRRESGMRRNPMSVSGERADLIALVDKLQPADEVRAQLAGVLDSYELDLDREIMRRDELRAKSEGAQQNMMAMFRPGADVDPQQLATAEKMITENREAMVRVRDVNRKYAKQVEAMLPADLAGEFSEAFKKASFPDVYRQRYAGNVLGAAEKLELSAEQTASLQAIRESYERDAAKLNQRAEAVQEEMEAGFSIQIMMNGGMWRNEKMQELRTDRDNLENTTVKKVQDLLSPEQRAKLPERGRGEGPDAGGGRGRNNDNQGDNPQRQRRQRPNQQRNQPTPPGGI